MRCTFKNRGQEAASKVIAAVLLILHDPPEEYRKKDHLTLAKAVEDFRDPEHNLSPENQEILELARDLVRGIAGDLHGESLDRFERDFLK